MDPQVEINRKNFSVSISESFGGKSQKPKTLWQLALEESKYWNENTRRKRLEILFHLAGIFYAPLQI